MMSSASSRRARRDALLAAGNVAADGGGRWAANPYSDDNPQGIIKMGSAENRLCHDMIKERFSRPDMLQFDESLQYYQNFRGTIQFRQSVASFMEDKLHANSSLNPEGIFVVNGGDSVIQQFAYAVADEGDGILIPTPAYSAVLEDFGLQFGVKAIPVPMDFEHGNEIGPSIEQLQQAYERANSDGTNVKALFIINPHNPTGLTMTVKNIKDCLQFAHSHDLHICFDEIYALSIYGRQHEQNDSCHEFCSVLSLKNTEIPNLDNVHIIYGFSKDFALSGYRVGIFYTTNHELQDAFTVSSYYHNVPNLVQYQLHTMLLDADWVNSYLAHNRDRLRTARYMLSDALDHLNIPYIDGRAGFFLWVDFSQVLYESSVLAEKQMYFYFLNNGVFVDPGQTYFASKPGFMRVVFTIHMPHLKSGIKKIQEIVHKLRNNPNVIADIDIDAEKKKTSIKGYY